MIKPCWLQALLRPERIISPQPSGGFPMSAPETRWRLKFLRPTNT